MIEIYEKINTAIKNNITAYLVTLIEYDGRAKSVKNSKMLVYENGDSFGSIGGKEIET
ncbi:MAG: XdhC family protein, partial [Bacteroidales bacterium]|nr:XdhC family protein [Bacteroidales bacterium]